MQLYDKLTLAQAAYESQLSQRFIKALIDGGILGESRFEYDSIMVSDLIEFMLNFEFRLPPKLADVRRSVDAKDQG